MLLVTRPEWVQMEDYNGVGKTHLPKIRDLRDSIHANYGEDAEIDWEIVHNAGCTCDDTELPHHVSEPGEIQELLTQFLVTLEKWTETGSRPLAVTVARSSLDDFCPAHQVEDIQEKTLQIVKSTLGQVVIHLLYDTEIKT